MKVMSTILGATLASSYVAAQKLTQDLTVSIITKWSEGVVTIHGETPVDLAALGNEVSVKGVTYKHVVNLEFNDVGQRRFDIIIDEHPKEYKQVSSNSPAGTFIDNVSAMSEWMKIHK